MKRNGGADEIEFVAQVIFEETLIAEVQRLLLIGEDQKGGRREFRLGDVVDAHRASFGRGAALQVHFVLSQLFSTGVEILAAARFASID